MSDWKGTSNPGKLNTSMWETASKKKDKKKPKSPDKPKKVNIYGKTFSDDKNSNTPSSKPQTVVITDNNNAAAEDNKDDDENKEDMMETRGKCNQAGCKCAKYIKNPSKWSKGKCKTCDHAPASHQQIWIKKEDYVEEPVTNTPVVNSPVKSPVKTPVKTPEPEPKIEEQLENLWGDDFTDKLTECVSKTLNFDAQSILEPKYLLHYLKKRINFSFAGQTKHRDALKFVCVKLFGWEAIGIYGYNVCVLDNNQNE